jgi:hypothetical protein
MVGIMVVIYKVNSTPVVILSPAELPISQYLLGRYNTALAID